MELTKIFVTNIEKLQINLAIFVELEQQKLCKKIDNYYIIATNIKLNSEHEDAIRFNIMMIVANKIGYKYLQIFTDK